ncbi:MAG: ArsA family ATPase [Spirochaetales bacterium]|nr:ArsA family ATPase [Spirochaetales bacterium]
MKILFFIGKGGVGKSTHSALFALQLARNKQKVFLNSIDPAHNLNDIFKIPLGSRPKEIIHGLTAVETDLDLWIKKYLRDTERDFKSIYRYQEAFNLQKYFKTLKYTPGLEEYSVLLALRSTIEKNKDSDYIIFDTPPTALTLRFLALPQTSLLWLKELKEFRKCILDKKEIITRIRKGKGDTPEEKDPVMLKIDGLIQTYEKLSSLIKNTSVTQIFLVLNPDKLSFSESTRTRDTLDDLGIPIYSVILNKYAGQESFIKQIKREFRGSLFLKTEKQDKEIIGMETLASIPLDFGHVFNVVED